MEDEDEDSKTEEPTQRRIERAQEEGDVPKSTEIPTLFTLGAMALFIAMAAGPMMKGMVAPLRGIMEHADSIRVGQGFGHVMGDFLIDILPNVMIPLGLMMLAGVAAHLIQNPLQFTPQKLMPDLSKISLIEGFKRQFSLESVINLVKGLVKLVIVGVVMFSVLWPRRNDLESALLISPLAQLSVTQGLASQVMRAVLAAFVIIAGLDYLWVRQRWTRKHRMTLYEVKQEHKEQEGDPHIKNRLRQIRATRARKRMTAAVPKATVVITNPTHYSVALRYATGMSAPVCVAKGVDEVARIIRELARQHDVPIVENPPLARTLYATVDVDKPIQEEQFKAVAEVIGYVLGLKSRRKWKAG